MCSWMPLGELQGFGVIALGDSQQEGLVGVAAQGDPLDYQLQLLFVFHIEIELSNDTPHQT